MIDDPKRFKFTGDQFYLKSSAEMRSLWAELPESCDNTPEIAERATWSLTRCQPHATVPPFPTVSPRTLGW